MSGSSFLKEYRNVASTLAAVSTYLGSYSLIDRMSNALSADSVNRVIYEMSRILNSVSKDENPKIRQCKDEKKQGILVIRESDVREESDGRGESDVREYFIDGNIAETSELELFLEDAEKNPHIARSLASLAMYLSAKAQLNGGIRK
ncbi:MAG: hypothetical protein ACO0C9_01550 [Candidatus Methanosuratincola verstraetei]|jgi:CRISPR type I-A-associated protein Csa5